MIYFFVVATTTGGICIAFAKCVCLLYRNMNNNWLRCSFTLLFLIWPIICWCDGQRELSKWKEIGKWWPDGDVCFYRLSVCFTHCTCDQNKLYCTRDLNPANNDLVSVMLRRSATHTTLGMWLSWSRKTIKPWLSWLWSSRWYRKCLLYRSL